MNLLMYKFNSAVMKYVQEDAHNLLINCYNLVF